MNDFISTKYLIFDVNYVIFGASVLMEFVFFSAWTYILASSRLKAPNFWSFQWYFSFVLTVLGVIVWRIVESPMIRVDKKTWMFRSKHLVICTFFIDKVSLRWNRVWMRYG